MKNTKFRVEKASQAPSELDRCIRLEKLCNFKKKITSIGPPIVKLSTSKVSNITKVIDVNKHKQDKDGGRDKE